MVDDSAESDRSSESGASTPPAPESSERLSDTTVPKSADILERERRGRSGTEKAFGGRAGMTYRVQNLAAEFQGLATKAANGDLMAARTLFEGLQNCERAPTSLRQLKRSREITAASFAQNPRPPGDYSRGDPVASDAMILARYERCNGIDDDHLAQLAKFGSQLAESGDAMARLSYSDFARPRPGTPNGPGKYLEVREQAFRYLDEELARGDERALNAYASIYLSPHYSAKDPYLAYVYSYAAQQREGGPVWNSSHTALRVAQSQLTADQISQAQREGVALYRECCRRP